MSGDNPVRGGRAERALTNMLVVLLVLLPAVNSLTVVRSSSGPPAIGFLPFALAATLAGIVVLFLTLIARPAGSRTTPLRAQFPLLAGLVAYLALIFAAREDFDAARNLLIVLVAFISLTMSARAGNDLFVPLRFGLRLVVLYSVVALSLWPAWYVNASEFFVDSGKIIPSLPNAQGVLSHPNYTGLLLGSVVLVELALLPRQSKTRVPLLFAITAAALLIFSQARNAILATIIASVVVLLARRGVWSPARFVLVGALVVSLVPLGIILYSYLSGLAPNFSAFAPWTNRGALWQAIAVVIPDSPLFGSGIEGIERARSFVTDRDVLEVTHAHNQILTLAVFGGAIALIFFVAYVLSMVNGFRVGAAVGPAGLALMVALTSITESPLSPYVTQAGVVLTIILTAASCRGSVEMAQAAPGMTTRDRSARGPGGWT